MGVLYTLVSQAIRVQPYAVKRKSPFLQLLQGTKVLFGAKRTADEKLERSHRMQL
jgi:hypothetical protein